MTDQLRLNAISLRVLAHPLRARLLAALRMDGAATATELAASLNTNTGATSYHLRRLESVGLVRDTGEGIGKRRVWESATRAHEWSPSEFAGNPDSEASLAWLDRFYRTFHDERAAQWAQHGTDWPGHWRDALGSGDDGVLVTASQARELRAEIEAVIRRYHHAGAGDLDALRVLVYTDLFPFDATPPSKHE